MSDIIEIPLTKQQRSKINPQEMIVKAAGFGITLRTNGEFSGKASGRVDLHPDKAVITITDRPWLVPLTMIKSQLTKMLTFA